MRLLFLNNNLHVVHHENPGVAWYVLPQRFARERAEVLRRNGGYYFSGYGALVWRYGLRPKERPWVA